MLSCACTSIGPEMHSLRFGFDAIDEILAVLSPSAEQQGSATKMAKYHFEKRTVFGRCVCSQIHR